MLYFSFPLFSFVIVVATFKLRSLSNAIIYYRLNIIKSKLLAAGKH